MVFKTEIYFTVVRQEKSEIKLQKNMRQIYNEQMSTSEFNVLLLVYMNYRKLSYYRKYSVSLFLTSPEKVRVFFNFYGLQFKN